MVAALDKTTVVAAKDIDAKNLALITNMPIDDNFFDLMLHSKDRLCP